MESFREWLKLEEEDQASHSGTYDSALNVGREAMVGMSLTLNGTVGNKVYNMLPTVVQRFLPDAEKPTRVELAIDSSTNPHLAQQVVWSGSEGDPRKAPADTGTIIISIQEFDQALGAAWQPAIQQAASGGMM